MLPRHSWEENERRFLAPYAIFSADSLGRRYPEKEHPLRAEFQRDRDRIIHSTAFRRLEYKTQVVINGAGDHFRTRLTHTIEVASISRAIARALALNEDLAEAIALAHDLGHPPFGHHGEDTLNQLMAMHGGFEHNKQSLRIVEELEMKYPEFNGLNLTQETRDGIRQGHHSSPTDELQPSLEAQITDIADEIAYCCHDLDDILQHNLLDVKLLPQVALCQKIDASIRQQYPSLDAKHYRLYLIRCLIDTMAADLYRQSADNLAQHPPADAQAARQLDRRLIAFSPEMREQAKELHGFLYQHFYEHPKIAKVKERACSMLQALFDFFNRNPRLIGDKTAARIEKEGKERAVCDYIAGMTDRYAIQLYAQHFGAKDLQQELGLLF
ncbi:MAG: deoxyguanosinetriphosphate triphosphohydrolase [bacterium]